MKILITGIGGFVGGHLAERLSKGEHELFGVTRPKKSTDALKHLKLSKPVELLEADLCDASSLKSAVDKVRPDWVVHLAGFARNTSQEEGFFKRVNVEVTKSLCDALVPYGPKTRILFVSTGLVYGDLGDEKLDGFDESKTLHPHKEYAASKVEAEVEALRFQQRGDLDIVIARPFNHTGPGQTTDYPIPKFAKQLVEMERGSNGIIETRDLSSYRDYCDVRDVVAAYELILERGESGGVYNIGSGICKTMSEILQLLIHHSGKTATPMPDGSPPPKGDVKVTKCNSRKLEALGWRRQYDLDATLKSVLAYWEEITPRSN